MNRFEAAQKVNEALEAADVLAKIADPKCEGFVVEIDGQVASCDFAHGAHAVEQRKADVAKFRAHLVAEMCARPEPKLQDAVDMEPQE